MKKTGFQAKKLPFESIPIVDLAPWFSHDFEAKAQVAHQVHSVCCEVGFMYIKNHEISQEKIDRAFQAARHFFALPEAEKQRVHFKYSGYHRGYVPIRAEITDPNDSPDLKEAFDVGLEVVPDFSNDSVALRMQSPNLWPEDCPSLREDVEQYFEAARSLASTLFEIFAAGFNLPINFFRDKIGKPIAQMRLLHYPTQLPTGDALGIGAHCDYECFTILAQDEAGGLQVQNQVGEWIEAPPIPGTFVINIGEMLSRWTNDTFVATPHRVISISGKERYSIPFFFATNYETVIDCLDPCITLEDPAHYLPITAGDYLAKRLLEIYGRH